MKIQYLSDLHLEFHPDGGKAFIDTLDPQGVDVLILAGDVISQAQGKQAVESLGYICRRYKNARVLYVTGNHEYYGGTVHGLRDKLQAAVAKNKNLRWMDSRVVEIQGQRFVGTSLWYQWNYYTMGNDPAWSDFTHIRFLKAWINDTGTQERRFLMKEVRSGDIVITHFLPSESAVAPRWRGAPTKGFFVSPMDDLIMDRQPRLWIHGHTHDTIKATLGATSILANPFGYFRREVNPNFDPRALIEI